MTPDEQAILTHILASYLPCIRLKYLALCMLGIFSCLLLSSADFSKNLSGTLSESPKVLGPVLIWVQTVCKKISADDKSRQLRRLALLYARPSYISLRMRRPHHSVHLPPSLHCSQHIVHRLIYSKILLCDVF